MIHLQTLDRKIWRKDLLFAYLQKCADTNKKAVIDFTPEGSCAQALGLYRLLDEFCEREKYTKSNISIKTANMVETHDEYNIIKMPTYWYEIPSIQRWVKNKTINITYTPTKHFANFTSRSNWYRLWIATLLDKKYPNKTIQTYHYDPDRENYNNNGYIGIDELFKRKSPFAADAAQFIQSCPRTIDIEYLKDLRNTKGSLFQHENSYYPIQHPSNLNLLQYYNDIFVDVVCEPNISGNCFLVTEKLWRIILAKRPFIVVSNLYYLQNLKKLGFKTFNDFWDEGYDEYPTEDRIYEIEKVLEMISEWDLEKLSSKLHEMQSILDHNYNTFMNLTHNKLKEIFK